MCRFAPRLLLLLLLAGPAGAVIVDGSETGTTSAPADDPGWVNVARMGGITGVYLENGWVLSAWHAINPVFPNFVTLDGNNYTPIVGSGVQLKNPAPVPQNGTPTDLGMLRIENPPSLPPVVLSSTPAAVGEDVIMIGFGRKRGSSYNGCPPGANDGWFWQSGVDAKIMRWGTNEVSTALQFDQSGSGATWIHWFKMRFDRSLPTPQEATSVNGDSGGAVFVKRSGTWELVGIMFANDNAFGSDPNIFSILATPGETCGSINWTDRGSLAADVYVYRGEIQKRLNPGVPSSSSGGLVVLAAILFIAAVPVGLLARRSR